jgi:hypothetical protein
MPRSSTKPRLLSVALGVLGLASCLTACTSGPPPTAEQVTNQLATQVHTASLTTVFTAETDPDKLLGRPGGYLSKTEFADSRIKADPAAPDGMNRGGSVEVFADTNGATKRREYLETTRNTMPILGSEYDYQGGPILVRVSHELTPDQAAEYKTALDNIASGKVPAPSPSPTPPPPAVQVQPAQPGVVSVESVHDAATIVLTDGTRLRQVGISAPSPDTCQAKQATATTDAEVRRGPLAYQLLGQSDVYGNQWAYLQVSGTDFGEKLASLGWVWAYPDSPAPQTYNQRITNQVDVARAAQAGMFGTTCPGAAPPPPPGVPAPQVGAPVPQVGPPPAAAPAQSIGGDGTYVVGTDIQAGTYRTSGPSQQSPGQYCSWTRRKDTTGEATSVIASNVTQGPTTVTIKPTDGAFESRGCNPWTKVG